MSEREVILIHETVLQSWVKDIVSFVSLAGIIGLGWWLDSAAMQWAGFILFALSVMGRARKYMVDGVTTPQKAADSLHEKYGVIATTDKEG